MNFSAVILAGGKSSRMGCDKAFIEIAGQTLLTRHIQLVRTAGAREIVISGRAETDYSAFGLPVLQDSFPDAGPLAGIHSALQATTSPLLLVLAVDLPAMTADFLQTLTAGCSENTGVVPSIKENLEPLAAIYPKAALPLATSLLAQNSLTVKNFARQCEQAGLISFIDLPDSATEFFLNCNSPGELESLRLHSSR
ncbi:MAG TPA: molybdenum cofactor guanylyltransferase [Verrucomicrobiae bacterium]|nr:molybdenum cofactor guanylyltransferase [Verrucomicrobiae bacterium]